MTDKNIAGSATVAWSNRLTFILAATGSAVGLGNIWKFPYITGENGGGAFVLVYLACILLAGIPVMMAEVLIGRRGGFSPICACEHLAVESGRSRNWRWVGGIGMSTGLIILTYYSVIAGWSLSYIPKMATGMFENVDASTSSSIFSSLQADPKTMLVWHSFFIIMVVAVVAGGVVKGVGKAVEVLMPILFVLLLVLLGFAISEGEFGKAVDYLLVFDFSKLTGESVLTALGHAFFTLSIAMGAIMVYGSYMPKTASIGRTVMVIGFLDTAIALIAGLAIFPIVFANPGIEPGVGPGLVFETLPIAFGAISGGVLFGALFFVLLSIAAWTSAISLIEPAVAWFVEEGYMSRIKAVCVLSLGCWVVGIGSVLSFNHWSEYKVFGKFNWFDFIDFLTANITMPLGGILMAVFVGHLMNKSKVMEEMRTSSHAFGLWFNVLRWVSPVLIGIVFVSGMWSVFGGGH